MCGQTVVVTGFVLMVIGLGFALGGSGGGARIAGIFAGMFFGYALALIRARGEAHDRERGPSRR